MFARLTLGSLALIAWTVSLGAAVADCAIKAPTTLVSAGTLTFGTALSTPPQDFDDHGEPAGFDIDVGKAVAGRLCLKPAFVNLAFPGLFPGLGARKFDAVVAGLGITPQREEVFTFVPYLQGGIQLVVRKDANLAFKDVAGLCGHSVATVTGSVEARALEATNKDTCAAGKAIAIKVYPSFNEAVQQLLKGNSEVAFVDWPFAAYIINLMPNLALGSPALSSTSGRRNREGIATRKDDAATHEAIQQALAAVESSGDYDKILDHWHMREGDIRQATP